jgi:NAD(P)-dependent dehydrogenase (short-subunit alcohol dehydrogenase family)
MEALNDKHGNKSSGGNRRIARNRFGACSSFRSRNYRVIALSRSIKQSADPNVVTVQGDVADPKTADLVFKEASERFGRVDTLVNNAGMFMAKPFTAYSNDDYAAYIATNVTGFFHMTQRATRAPGLSAGTRL